MTAEAQTDSKPYRECPCDLQAAREQFQRDGYLVCPGFWSAETVADVRGAISRLLEGSNLDESKTIFSTRQQSHASDDYFLGSGDKIRFFWEENAFDADGNFKQDTLLSINKIGHALHDLSPTFECLTYNERLGELSRKVGDIEVPLAVQSMYICKQPKIGGEVTPHQDGTFLYTSPQSALGFWWALEDCSTTNGCLWVVPGSHKQGVKRRFKRRAGGQPGTEYEPAGPPEPFDLIGAVPLEVAAGTMVVLHNAVVHYSHENRSDQSRHAYTLHVVDGKCDYLADNWLQRPPDHPFRELP